MPTARCPICFNHLRLVSDKPEIVIFPCGHGYCKDCTDGIFQDARPKCPHCRVALDRKTGHPVYLELMDSVSTASATDEAEDDTMVQNQKQEIDRLGLSLRQSEHNTKEALCLAEKAKVDLEMLRETSAQWQKRAKELDQDNRRLKDHLLWLLNDEAREGPFQNHSVIDGLYCKPTEMREVMQTAQCDTARHCLDMFRSILQEQLSYLGLFHLMTTDLPISFATKASSQKSEVILRSTFASNFGHQHSFVNCLFHSEYRQLIPYILDAEY